MVRSARQARSRPRFGQAVDHLPYLVGAVAVTAGVLVWRLGASTSAFEDRVQWWLGWIALTLLLVCVGLVLRKQVYGTRLGGLRPYYLLHLWAGAAWGPIVLIHADLQARGFLYLALAATAAVTWVSGLVVVWVQEALKRRLGDQHGAAGLRDDLVAARTRLAAEVDGLVAAQPPEWHGLAGSSWSGSRRR